MASVEFVKVEAYLTFYTSVPISVKLDIIASV